MKCERAYVCNGTGLAVVVYLCGMGSMSRCRAHTHSLTMRAHMLSLFILNTVYVSNRRAIVLHSHLHLIKCFEMIVLSENSWNELEETFEHFNSSIICLMNVK